MSAVCFVESRRDVEREIAVKDCMKIIEFNGRKKSIRSKKDEGGKLLNSVN
jgi:hypothetical protein